MHYSIPNECFRDIKKADGTPAFPARFTEKGLSAEFELMEGKDRFQWSGMPGESYRVYAPLPAREWEKGEAASFREHFGNWRCAVFTPRDMDEAPRVRPVVVAFTGIGADYSDNQIYIRRIVEQMGAIMVTFDTHLTGLRVLTWDKNVDGNPWRFYTSLRIMKDFKRPFNNDCMQEFTAEMAFNIEQVCMMIHQRYGLPVDELPPVITLGFSLGGYYAARIAGLLPNCIGCSSGAASFDIMHYGGMFGMARTVPECLLRMSGIFGPLAAYANLALAIKNTTYHPFNGATASGEDIPFRFIIGTNDEIVNYRELEGACQRSGRNWKVVTIPGVHHTPVDVKTIEMNGVGNGMLDAVAERAHWWWTQHKQTYRWKTTQRY